MSKSSLLCVECQNLAKLCAIYFSAFQEGWCDSQGTLDEIREKLQSRKEGAIKRERALAYSLSRQVEHLGSKHLCQSIDLSCMFKLLITLVLAGIHVWSFSSNVGKHRMECQTLLWFLSSTMSLIRATQAGAGWKGGWQLNHGRTD